MTYTNLNLSRLANAALDSFTKRMLPLNAFSRSFSPESVTRTRGNVVLVPLVGTLTATTFGNSYAICGGTKSVVTVTISRHKVVHIGQHDLDAANNSESSLDSLFAQAGRALAQAVVEDVLTLVTTANFGAVGSAVSSTDIGMAALRAGKLALDQANAPSDNRNCLIDAVGMDALLAVTNFIQASLFGDRAVVRDGNVNHALGMDFYTLNSSFTSAASVNAFFCTPEAIAIAMRYLEPQRPTSYDAAQAVTDPQTGATFGIRDYFDPGTGTRYVALEANYGYSTGITNAGRVFKRLD